ncbi:hypothetical protein CRUP_036071 [Coryphaenoides rupestris]|nr:hypothetical protein CRUP_036071 [Coryphaenoides rupestris]
MKERRGEEGGEEKEKDREEEVEFKRSELRWLMFPIRHPESLETCQGPARIYETPGGTILYQAHLDIETFTMDKEVRPGHQVR